MPPSDADRLRVIANSLTALIDTVERCHTNRIDLGHELTGDLLAVLESVRDFAVDGKPRGKSPEPQSIDAHRFGRTRLRIVT